MPHVRQVAEAWEHEVDDELREQWIERVLEHAAVGGVNNNGLMCKQSAVSILDCMGRHLTRKRPHQREKRLIVTSSEAELKIMLDNYCPASYLE